MKKTIFLIINMLFFSSYSLAQNENIDSFEIFCKDYIKKNESINSIDQQLIISKKLINFFEKEIKLFYCSNRTFFSTKNIQKIEEDINFFSFHIETIDFFDFNQDGLNDFIVKMTSSSYGMTGLNIFFLLNKTKKTFKLIKVTTAAGYTIIIQNSNKDNNEILLFLTGRGFQSGKYRWNNKNNKFEFISANKKNYNFLKYISK